MVKKATFGAGCFWHVEEGFRKVKGVLKTTVGYMGGTVKNPTYGEVCTDQTGHIETCQVQYDPKIISYEGLLDIFWDMHDPTQLNRQGPDIGIQYKSIIFYHDAKQKKLAEASKKEKQKKFTKKIVTEIIKAETFYEAEEYHQRYLLKRGKKVC